MNRWFRFYNDAMNNPKIARLSDKDFRFWMQLLCLASREDGLIPGCDDVVLMLRERRDYAERALKRLCDASLLEPKEGGYEPRNWDKHQYKSDTSTDRTRKFRRSGNVPETGNGTAPETETDTEAEKKESPARGAGENLFPPASEPEKKAKPARLPWRKAFEEWWVIYPRKDGKMDAERVFRKVYEEKEVPLQALIDGASAYAKAVPDRQFQKLPAGWLRAGRWADEHDSGPGGARWSRPPPRKPTAASVLLNINEDFCDESGSSVPFERSSPAYAGGLGECREGISLAPATGGPLNLLDLKPVGSG